MSNFKPLRRSQLISPWGVGQMVNFPGDETLMVAGLDMWEEIFERLRDAQQSNLDEIEFIVEEERLARRLRVRNFRLPPDFRNYSPGVVNPGLRIPFVRFPRWHYCPKCGLMQFMPLYMDKKRRCPGYNFGTGQDCSGITDRRRNHMIPVRFVVVCENGHIQDFPFREWVHNGNDPGEEGHKLRLRAGRSSGSISGIKISCTCGAEKTLAGAFNKGALNRLNVYCAGEMPWLGQVRDIDESDCHCSAPLIMVQKGGSNVYFPKVTSSIYLPQWDKGIDAQMIELLENNWTWLTDGTEEGDLSRERFRLVAGQKLKPKNIDEWEAWTDRLMDAARKRNERRPVHGDSEERYRKAEYDAILTEPGSQNEDFFVSKIPAGDYHGGEGISRWFNNIALVHKLRETRAFTGFTRLWPEDNKTLEDRKNFIKLGQSINWLPAIVVRGEGVFFEFDRERLKKWANQEKVRNRARRIASNHRNPDEQITPEFILIHTFAHLVINQFSFECGYGSSALRERIYCNVENPDEPMHGVLIYTASGDSEGSLGGLVRQGKPGNLESIVMNALENARWCSSDPVCIESSGQGPDSCNLAACHNCALLPETCCERSNKLLDRGLVTGTPDEPEVGYFYY